jgi:hypothetical protein
VDLVADNLDAKLKAELYKQFDNLNEKVKILEKNIKEKIRHRNKLK